MTNTEKSVFNVIGTVIKEQMGRIGVTANIRLVDKVTWMNTTLQDAPWDMYVEDLLSLITLDSNAYLTTTPSTWNTSRHTDAKVDALYDRYASELDATKRQVIARELAEHMVDNMYWNVISGSPFYMVAQPSVKGYTYNAEFEVHYDDVWLGK
jgi:ABC-type transport system substrate-binding protein